MFNEDRSSGLSTSALPRDLGNEGPSSRLSTSALSRGLIHEGPSSGLSTSALPRGIGKRGPHLKWPGSGRQRHRVLRAPGDKKLRIRLLSHCAQDVPVAPARCELLARQLRVAPAQPVAEHARCCPDVDGGKSPVAKDGLPAGGQDPSCHHPSCLRCTLLVPRALVGSPQLADGDQPHAVPKWR